MNPATSKTELLALIVNSFHLLTILAKSTISDFAGYFDWHLHIRKKEANQVPKQDFSGVKEISDF